MAYVVGSVSVEVVPDFRNAQNAITAWFKSQPDQFKIPVRPDIDQPAAQRAEAQAQQVGERIGKALADGAERTSVRSGLADRLSRQIARLEADIEKARRTSGEATKALQVAETRLSEARKAGNRAASTMMALEQSVEKQRLRISDADRIAAESQAQLVSVRRQLAEETAAIAEREAATVIAQQEKVAAAEARLAEQSMARLEAEARAENALRDRQAAAAEKASKAEARAEIKAIEKAAAEAARARAQQGADESRARERAMRDELRAEQAQAKKLVQVYERAFREAEKQRLKVEIDEQQAIKSGRNAGGLIMRATREEIRQNAGLIASAVGGALMLGGPVILAAATGLFAGIGAAAALQSQEVRSSFAGLWDDIKSQSIVDAQSLVPAFERVAGAIDQSFQRIRPALQDIFKEVAPQLEEFTVMALRAGEVAMPGLTRAVQANAPVIRGLGLGLIEIGEGFSDFFDILAQGAPTAGQVFLDFGELVRTALPLLAELGLVGMEVATGVLPALTTALRGANVVVDLLGGALPSLLTGFLAFRVIGGIGAQMRDWSAKAGVAAMQGGAFAGAQQRAAGALSSVGRALPVVGVAVGLLGVAVAANEQQINDWSQALINGGTAARIARSEMVDFDEGVQQLNSGFTGFISNFSLAGPVLDALAQNTKTARERADEYRASLDPLARAQLDVKTATADLSAVLSDESSTAGDLSDAQAEVARATARVAEEQAALEMATKGATEAMAEQADAARARVDSTFAYQQSILDLKEAQDGMNDAFSEFGRNSDEGRQALLDFKTALTDVITAAGDKAFDALPAGMGETEKAAFRAAAEIAEMDRLISEGFVLPPALQQYYDSLQSIAAGADTAALEQGALIAALGEVGIAAEAIPNSKSVKVEALTDDARARLEDLGFSIIELDDGSFEIVAESSAAQASLDNISGLLAGIDGSEARPVVSVNDSLLRDGYSNAMDLLRTLGVQVAAPVLDARDRPFVSKESAARIALGKLGGMEAEPVVDLFPGPFNSVYENTMGDLGNLGRQNPTPTVAARDNASGVLSYVLGLLDRADGYVATSSVVTTFTTINRSVAQTIFGADGGAPGDMPSRNAPQFMGPPQRFAFGGAAVGTGSSREDRIPALVGNGEHVLDGRDVALMGGQAGVYAFREMLNSGRIGGYGQGSMIQDRLQTPSASAGATTVKGFENNGSITFANQEDFFRQVYAAERAAIAQVLNA